MKLEESRSSVSWKLIFQYRLPGYRERILRLQEQYSFGQSYFAAIRNY